MKKITDNVDEQKEKISCLFKYELLLSKYIAWKKKQSNKF